MSDLPITGFTYYGLVHYEEEMRILIGPLICSGRKQNINKGKSYGFTWLINPSVNNLISDPREERIVKIIEGEE